MKGHACSGMVSFEILSIPVLCAELIPGGRRVLYVAQLAACVCLTRPSRDPVQGRSEQVSGRYKQASRATTSSASRGLPSGSGKGRKLQALDRYEQPASLVHGVSWHPSLKPPEMLDSVLLTKSLKSNRNKNRLTCLIDFPQRRRLSRANHHSLF